MAAYGSYLVAAEGNTYTLGAIRTEMGSSIEFAVL
jgi:hypothetical protein